MIGKIKNNERNFIGKVNRENCLSMNIISSRMPVHRRRKNPTLFETRSVSIRVGIGTKYAMWNKGVDCNSYSALSQDFPAVNSALFWLWIEI